MTDADRLRLLGFWLVCLPVRLGIAAIVAYATRGPLRYVAAAYVLTVAASLYGQALCVRPTHGRFGGVVWWGRARWVHAATWTLAGAMCLVPGLEGWPALPLVVDVGTAAITRLSV